MPGYINIREAAHIMGVTVVDVENMIAEGLIRKWMETRGQIEICQSDLQ